MSMSSTMSTRRRAPQQPRGELRLAQLLQAAASLLSEVGYDAATMTGIASRAQASIGTLYQSAGQFSMRRPGRCPSSR